MTPQLSPGWLRAPAAEQEDEGLGAVLPGHTSSTGADEQQWRWSEC